MRAKFTHRWDLSVDEAKRLQWELSARVVETDVLPEVIRYVAGADVHPVGDDRMHAVVCVLTFPDLQLLEVAHAIVPVTFPYVPGLLAFRESPAVLAAFEKLRHDPDVALFDAQGRAHPRHFASNSATSGSCRNFSNAASTAGLSRNANKPGTYGKVTGTMAWATSTSCKSGKVRTQTTACIRSSPTGWTSAPAT